MDILTEKDCKGYIYVCNFNNGMVKIGSDELSPLIGINRYLRGENVVNGDGTLTEFWISGPHHSFKEIERALVEKIGANMIDVHQMFCTGVDYLELVGFANSLVAGNEGAA